MKTLKDFIYESFSNESDYMEIIGEGINIDDVNKTVSLTTSHNKGVVFDDNDLYHFSFNIDDVTTQCYSIFKRTKIGTRPERDGNPFMYALKGKFGWTFDVTNKDIVEYCRKFINKCTKLQNDYDTVIMLPSSSKVNERFVKTIVDIIKPNNIIKDFLNKISIEEADDSLDRDEFKKWCEDNKKNYEQEYKKIKDAYDKMKDDNTFEAKFIPKDLLPLFHHTVTTNPKYEIFDIYNIILNKNVLVVDDIMSSGTTLRNSIKEIHAWGPKRIDVVTLLSPLND